MTAWEMFHLDTTMDADAINFKIVQCHNEVWIEHALCRFDILYDPKSDSYYSQLLYEVNL